MLKTFLEKSMLSVFCYFSDYGYAPISNERTLQCTHFNGYEKFEICAKEFQDNKGQCCSIVHFMCDRLFETMCFVDSKITL